MGAVTKIDIFCDGEGCSQWVGEGAANITEARKFAKTNGWVVKRFDGKLLDFCPSCAIKQQPLRPLRHWKHK